MQIESLNIFCNLVETGSFSRAAEKNFISQSAVSQQIAQFEMEFKCQLLDRSKRPFELTEAGQLFYESCKDIVSRYQKFRNSLTSLTSQKAGTIKIGAIFSIGMHSLQRYIKEFMSKFPNIKVVVDFCPGIKIYEDILDGGIDIGLVAIPHNDKNIIVHDFIDEPLVLVCSPENELAWKKQIDIHSLAMQKFIAFGKDVPTRKLIDDILKRYGVVVNMVMEFDNTETIKRAVEINSGVSILPEPTIRLEVANKSLVSIDFLNEKIYRPTGIVVNKNRKFPESTKYMISLLKSASAVGKNF
jgi:LysR family transcriptional regulator, transcriptional activator of the cysJI operon